MRRSPAVAGQFYAGDEKTLLAELESMFLGPLGPGRLPVRAERRLGSIVGLVVPHAGYVYSGYAAAAAFDRLAEDGPPEIAVIIGPNHYGIGESVAIMEQGIWDTPIGGLQIDEQVAARLLDSLPYVRADASAHAREHSLETQIPFLRYIAGNRIRILPMVLGIPAIPDATQMLEDIGSAIASALRGKNAVVIASTDMTHYESQDSVRRKDALAIEAVKSLDSAALIDVVNAQGISMCGAAPTAVAIEACKKLGAVSGELLQYYTSGDITGDTAQVVGYAAMAISRGQEASQG